MRGWSSVAALVLAGALSACSDGSAEPDVPEPGPLTLAGSGTRCVSTSGDTEVVVEGGATNPVDIPLTIDDVTLTRRHNLTVVEVALLPGDGSAAVPAVDATITETGTPASTAGLRLRLRVERIGEHASFSGFTVDYHNVEGRFRAVDTTAVDVLSQCPAP